VLHIGASIPQKSGWLEIFSARCLMRTGEAYPRGNCSPKNEFCVFGTMAMTDEGIAGCEKMVQDIG
jgi:hypothetical protein